MIVQNAYITASSAGASEIQTFDLVEMMNASSPGFHRMTLLFKQADCPSGKVPVIWRGSTQIDAQFDQRVTWPDGSLKLAVTRIRDTTFSALESRTYSVTVATGSFNNTGSKTVTDITIDPKIVFTSVTQTNDVPTTTTRGSGTFTASFNTHKATTTRTTKIASGPICEEWRVWGMAADNTGGALDAHLKTRWRVALWKNADGTIADTEFVAVVAQDWFNVAAKRRINYTATLKKGATDVQAYTVQHWYGGTWATVKVSDDNMEGRRFWNTAAPTLFTKWDRAYWISSWLVPPYDIATTPNSNDTIGYTARYTPLSNMNHRPDINEGGAYMGRGIFPNVDAVTFIRRTAADLRRSRCNALAGLSFPVHARSDQSRTRPGELSDTADTIYSLKLHPKSSGDYTFTSAGMPAPLNMSHQSGGDITPIPGEGYNGVWTNSTGVIAPSHAVNFCYFMYLAEGDDILLDAQHDLALHCAINYHYDSFGGNAQLAFYDTAVGATTPSTPTYGGNAMGRVQEVRSYAWAMNIIACASAITPDNAVEKGFIDLYCKQQADYVVASVAYRPADMESAGVWGVEGIQSSWMHNWVVMAAYHAYGLTRYSPFLTFAESVAPFTQGLSVTHNYRAHAYRLAVLPAAGQYVNHQPYLVGTNEYLSANDFAIHITGGDLTASDDRLTVTYFTGSGGRDLGLLGLTVNDKLYPTYLLDQEPPMAPPGYLTDGETLYVRDIVGTPINGEGDGQTCKLARSAGGTPVDFTSNAGCLFNWYPLAADSFAVAGTSGMPLPSGDDYAPICAATANIAYQRGTVVTLAAKNKITTFVSGVDYANWPNWKYAV